MQLGSLRIHSSAEEPVIVSPGIFCAVHRGIGILDQRFRIAAVLWVNTDPNAAPDIERMSLDKKRLAQDLHKPLRRPCRIIDPLDVGKHQHELVTADSCNRVLFSSPLLQALCHVLQQKISDRMPEAIVDCLEAVEVEKEQS